MKTTLKNISPNIEQNIVEIARVSSSREDKSEDGTGLINYLIGNNHWSPFEHGFITFEIVTSKAIAIQLLRHRSNFFQEFSQRYQDVNKVDGNGIYEDIEFRAQAKTNRQSSVDVVGNTFYDENGALQLMWDEHTTTRTQMDAMLLAIQAMEYCETAYNDMLNAGIARESARFVLPIGAKTRLYISMNVRSVIHWLDIRDDGHAQKEVQLIAKEIKEIFKRECPVISKARGYFD